MVARRNLGDCLFHSEHIRSTDISWLSQFPRSKGMFPCGHCQVCPYVHRTTTFSDSQNKKRFEIRSLINCAPMRVIYMLTCPCKKIYIGKTKRQFRIRLGEHMREILEKNPDKPLARHFAQYHWGKLSDMQVKGIYALNISSRRGDFDQIFQQKEKRWIFRLGSLVPSSLNTELNLQPFLAT